ncbi:hypothetical protein SDC9_154254 [bioreactor metagenome]|uniref:Uncharacterized protein n=1 Tax=bioreactor metagenome TaxID=1076179 RepID=A0A645EYJ5_9ZZZZ
MDLGHFCGLYDFFLGGVHPAVADVLAYRAREQEHILGHDADVAAQALESDAFDIPAIDGDAASAGFVKPGNEVAERGFARARRPDQREGPARLDF